MNYGQFISLTVVGTGVCGVAVFVLLPSWDVSLVPGLVMLWVELAIGIVANRVAHRLTKEAIVMKGVGIEQNPVARRMFSRGDFSLLRKLYAMMVIVNLFLTILSILEGVVWVGLPIMLMSFPLALIYDMLHDYLWLSRLKAPSSELSGNGTA